MKQMKGFILLLLIGLCFLLSASSSLMRWQDGNCTCKRPTRIGMTASTAELPSGESEVFRVFPSDAVGRLGNGVYRFYCFNTFADEPDSVYCSYYEFTL